MKIENTKVIIYFSKKAPSKMFKDVSQGFKYASEGVHGTCCASKFRFDAIVIAI